MKKLTYITLVVFILPLFLISCANEYDGGIYTGSSMSTNPTIDKSKEEPELFDSKEAVEENVADSEVEKIPSEENYK
jgi:hypothetical protein|tara:strand:+ start:57 stop:287 length:231 start_codon:yes stop_codon:yes gene_type:complete